MRRNWIADLNINDIQLAEYQRDMNMKKVAGIISNYDPHRDRPIEVSYRDGKYYCFDGQHRLLVHKMMGMKKIQAQIHEGLTYKQEAALFARQNDYVQPVSSADRWEASVEAGEEFPKTEEILAICKDVGFRVSAVQTTAANTICCIRELQNLYNDCGERGLRVILKLIKKAWDYQPKNTNHMIMGGLHYIYTHLGDVMTAERWDRMAEALGAYTPKTFLREVAGEDRLRYKGVAQQIVKIHNRGLNGRSKKRLDKEMLCDD